MEKLNGCKSNVALQQPESTAAVRHQCMNPRQVAKYFNAAKEVIKNCQAEQIRNMCMTGLQLDFKKYKIIAAKGTKYLHMWNRWK